MHRIAPTVSLVLTAFVLLTLAPTAAASPRDAVVRIQASLSSVALMQPWNRVPPTPVVGSGVILEDGRILTNAHVVQDAISVRVKQEGATRQFDAEVLFVQPQVDLALLRVADDGFNPDDASIPVGELPHLEQPVQALGYPEGGETLSITTGVVSRIEFEMVIHSFEWHLLLQTDAAINGGNSGGPLLADGALVGLNSQTLEEADNIAYAVSIPVIQQFLADVGDGQLDGVPGFGIYAGTVENPAEYRWLKIPDDAEGECVMTIDPTSDAARVLRRGDLITAVDGHPVGRDGTIATDDGLRIDWSFLRVDKQVGDEVTVEFLRAGKAHRESIRLGFHPPLVASSGSQESREFFVYGGVIFQPLTTDYLGLFEFENIPWPLGVPWMESHDRSAERRQIVVLNRVLADPLNRGYEEFSDVAVASIDGEAVFDLADLVRKLEEGKDRYARIRLADDGEIVFDRKEVAEHNADVLEVHGVRVDRRLNSDDARSAR